MQNNPLRWSRAGAVTGTTIKERGREKLNPATGTNTESQSGWAKYGAGGPLFLIVVNAQADA